MSATLPSLAVILRGRLACSLTHLQTYSSCICPSKTLTEIQLVDLLVLEGNFERFKTVRPESRKSSHASDYYVFCEHEYRHRISLGPAEGEAVVSLSNTTPTQKGLILLGPCVHSQYDLQVLQALGGHRSHVMTNPLKPFADKLQRAGKGISLVSLVQVCILWHLSIHLATGCFLLPSQVTVQNC